MSSDFDLELTDTALEPRAFSLQSPKAFFNLYAPPDHSPKESVQVWEDEVRSMARSVSLPLRRSTFADGADRQHAGDARRVPADPVL